MSTQSGLEKIRKNRENLEELARSDLRTSKYAQVLLKAVDDADTGGLE